MLDRFHHPAANATALGAADLDELTRLLAEPALWVEPPGDLAARAVDSVVAAARPGASVEAIPNPVRSAAPSPRLRRPRRSWYAVVAGSAAAIVAFCLALGLAGDRQQSPARYRVALQGTGLAPHVSGHATLTRTGSGWEVYLDADGLPRRAEGRYYAAWLKNAAGVLVPVGTFNEAHDVLLWSGVAPTAYPTFTVTRQRAGDQGSPGQVVAVGRAAPES
jgi:hypothetical protein